MKRARQSVSLSSSKTTGCTIKPPPPPPPPPSSSSSSSSSSTLLSLSSCSSSSSKLLSSQALLSYTTCTLPPKPPAKIVVVCGTKGGVGKTTTVLHLIEAATRLNVSVLAIDADTQCSLTRALLTSDDNQSIYKDKKKKKHNVSSDAVEHTTKYARASVEERKLKKQKDEESEEKKDVERKEGKEKKEDEEKEKHSPHDYNDDEEEEPTTDVTIETPNANLFDSYHTLVTKKPKVGLEENKKRKQEIKYHNTIADLMHLEIFNVRTNGKHLATRIREGVHLVPGSPDLVHVHIEHGVASDDMLRTTRRSAFRRIALQKASECNAQLVVVDVGPGVGVLNKTLVMSADACVPCSFADEMSITAATDFFTTIMPMFLVWHSEVMKQDKTYSVVSHRFVKTVPRLFPLLVSNYVLMKKKKKEDDDTVESCISLDDSRRIYEAAHYITKQSDSLVLDLLVPLSNTSNGAVLPMVPRLMSSAEPLSSTALDKVNARFSYLLEHILKHI